jgi:hypothetical protein
MVEGKREMNVAPICPHCGCSPCLCGAMRGESKTDKIHIVWYLESMTEPMYWGWQCPHCGHVYSPKVRECSRCPERVEYIVPQQTGFVREVLP